MAKKKDVLSLEEKLEKALVADWEQPYKVPGNWVWTKLDSICKLSNGEKVQDMELPYLEAKVLRGNKQSTIKNSGVFLSVGSKVILVDGENSGEVFNVYTAGYMGSTFKFLDIQKNIDDCLIEYFISIYKDDFKNSKVGSAIPHLNKELFRNLPFPLPPLAEQERIVARIESLFSKLDHAKELAQSALDTFTNRKSAILHKAFTGELTKNWRELNGVGFDSWHVASANDIFTYITSGSRGWAQYYSDMGSIFIRMGNLNHSTLDIDFSDIQYVQLPEKVEGRRSKVQKNDILISITADVGMVGIVKDSNMDAYINQHVALARPIESEYAPFIAWFLISDLGLSQLQKLQKGATKKGLSLVDFKSLKMNLPTLLEQTEIVRIIDSLFEKEEKAKEIANVIEQIDHMKKAILARAFRGELGTNDPNDENALDLLKTIILDTLDDKVTIKKVRTKEVKEMALSMIETLKKHKKLQPEELKKYTELDIESFYEEIKILIESGKICETRENDTIYLEVVNYEN